MGLKMFMLDRVIAFLKLFVRNNLKNSYCQNYKKKNTSNNAKAMQMVVWTVTWEKVKVKCMYVIKNPCIFY